MNSKWREAIIAGALSIGAAVLIVGLLIFAMLHFGAIGPSYGRELYPGQYAQVDPELRKWFRNQVSPATGTSCCSEADGTYVEEDIREGHYWIRFDKTEGKWMPVPDEIVIHDPNRNGAPVVWWYYDSDQAMIGFRCYAPGGGV